jgi:hypothetical protein
LETIRNGAATPLWLATALLESNAARDWLFGKESLRACCAREIADAKIKIDHAEITMLEKDRYRGDILSLLSFLG